MASLFQPFSTEDDDKNKDGSGSGNSSSSSQPLQPQSISGSSQASTITANGGAGSGQAQNQNQNAQQQGTSSGNYTNLQKYMTANQGFNNGQGLGAKVVNNINQAADQTKQQVNAAGNAFQQQAQSQINTWNSAQPLVQQAVADPSTFVQNNDNVAKVTAARDAQYTGPKSLQDLQGENNLANLQMKTQNVNDMANQGQTESGRFNLLRQMFGNQNYSRGQQSLDNLLVQGDKDQLRQMQATRQVAGDTANTLNAAQQQAQKTAADATQQAQQVQTDTRNAFNGAINTLDTSLQSKVDAGNALNQRLKDEVAKGTISAADAKLLGLQASTTDRLYTDDVYANKSGKVGTWDDYNTDEVNNMLNAWSAPMGDAYQEYQAAHGPITSDDLFNSNSALNQYINDKINNYGKVTDIENYGVDIGHYLNNMAATKQNVASADDYARYSALAKLAGVDPTLLTDPTQAGKFDSTSRLDLDNYNKAVDANKAAFEAQYNPLMSFFNNGDNFASHDFFDPGTYQMEVLRPEYLSKIHDIQKAYGYGNGLKIGD